MYVRLWCRLECAEASYVVLFCLLRAIVHFLWALRLK